MNFYLLSRDMKLKAFIFCILAVALLCPAYAMAQDEDGDGMPDMWENGFPCVNSSIPDGDVDVEPDGLVNLDEFNLLTNPCNADTDGDQMPDGWEATYWCVDPTLADGNGDPDADLSVNLDEYQAGTDPCVSDGGSNGDSDGDGMPDFWEEFYNCVDVAVPDDQLDPDGDLIVNYDEYIGDTDPCVYDGSSQITPSLSGPGRTINPGEVFQVDLNVDLGSHSLTHYRFHINFPAEMLTLLHVEGGGNSDFGEPLFEYAPGDPFVSVFGHNMSNTEPCSVTGSVKLATLVFQMQDWVYPGFTGTVELEPAAELIDCIGLDLIPELEPYPWQGATINTVSLASVQGASNMQKFMDLDGDYLPSESDAILLHQVLGQGITDGNSAYASKQTRQCDINGNADTDIYDVGRMDAFLRPARLIHGGTDGICDTTASGDDIQEIPAGQGEPNTVIIKAGADGILDSTPLGDDTVSGRRIISGADGIADSTASGDDTQEIPLGKGMSNMLCISPGDDQAMSSTATGDDGYIEDAKPTANFFQKYPQKGTPVGIVPIEPVSDVSRVYITDVLDPIPITVSVVDSNGRPKAGMSPNFSVTAGSGYFFGTGTNTISQLESDFFRDIYGAPRGEVTAVLQPTLGINQVTVTLDGQSTLNLPSLPSITFNINVLNQDTVSPTYMEVSTGTTTTININESTTLGLILKDGNTALHGRGYNIEMLSERNYLMGYDPTNTGKERKEAIFYDNFEGGDLSNWSLIPGTGAIAGTTARSSIFGDWSVGMETSAAGGSSLSMNVVSPTLNYKELSVSFQWMSEGSTPDLANIELYYASDSDTTWRKLMKNDISLSNGRWLPERFSLTSASSLRDRDVMIKFVLNTQEPSQKVYIDNFMVSGYKVIFEQTFENNPVDAFPGQPPYKSMHDFHPPVFINTGPDGILDSTTLGDDLSWFKSGGNPYVAYIFSGPDNTLDTTPQGDDEIGANNTINTGANGIAETTATGDDYQEIESGFGQPFAAAVFPGPDLFMGSIPDGDDQLVGINIPGTRIAVDSSIHQGSATGAGAGDSDQFLFIGRQNSGPFEMSSASIKVDLGSLDQAKLSFYTRTNGQADFASLDGTQEYQEYAVEVSDNGGRSWVKVWDSKGRDISSWTEVEIDLADDSRFLLRDDFLIRWRANMNGSESDDLDPDGVYLDDVVVTGANEVPDDFGPVIDTNDGTGRYDVEFETLVPGDTVRISAMYVKRGMPTVFADLEGTLEVLFRKAEADSVQVLPDNFTLDACDSMEVTVIGRFTDTPVGQVEDMTELFDLIVHGPARETAPGVVTADCFTGTNDVPIQILAKPKVPGLYDPGGGGSGQQTGDVSGRIYKPTFQGAGNAPIWLDLGNGNVIYSHTDSSGFHFFPDVPAGSGYVMEASLEGYTKKAKINITVNAGENTSVCFAVQSGTNFDGDTLDDDDDSDDDDDGVDDASEGTAGSSGYDPDSDGDGITDDADLFPGDSTEWADNDSDGIGDNTDTDDDNDTISDTEENTVGSDGYITDPNSADSDGGGEDDASEIAGGRDPNNASDDVVDNDTDDDGIDDSVEVTYGYSVSNPDTDGDGLCDGDTAVYDGDTTLCIAGEDIDKDGVVDSTETDALDDDTDDDGSADGADCNALDANVWTSCGTCQDGDTDSYYAGCDAYTTINGPDCSDSDPNNWTSCASCVDGDTDGEYTGCDAYVTINEDCSDSDPNNWDSCASCVDGDTDGEYTGCDAYFTIGEDCSDSDPNNWDSCGSCVDGDTDGYYAGCDAYVTISGPDCSDSDQDNWNSCGTCLDSDLDTWYAGCDAYTTRSGPDCSDSNPNNWTSCATCLDGDTDSYYVSCDTYSTISGPDCSDSDPNNWTSCASCVDGDTDGEYTGCDAYVTINEDCSDSDPNNWDSCATCVDGDTDSYYVSCDAYTTISGPDCSDSDPNNWTSCGTCLDGDSDTYYVGCDAYVTINGPDCGDTDGDNWVSCSTCLDTDSDTWYTGCDAYISRNGIDCNDGDSVVYPGASELCDEKDNQCPGDSGYGTVDEGCVTDTDGDGISDSDEVLYGYSVSNPDTDGDGLCDGGTQVLQGATVLCEAGEDVDGDGVLDAGESDPLDTDTDDDGLNDLEESNYNTDPTSWDSDDDGLPDGYEVAHSGDTVALDPLDVTDGDTDFDGDYLENAHEYWNGSDPWDFELDNSQHSTGCFYWAESGTGNGILGPEDISEFQAYLINGSANYDGVIPPSVDVQELNADGIPDPTDLSIIQNMILGESIASLGSRPQTMVTLDYPGSTVAVGSTCHVEVGLQNEESNYTSGFGILFEIDSESTGSARIFGGDGSSGSGRYDFTMYAADDAPARVVLIIDSAGTIYVNASVPQCGTGTLGKSAPSLSLTPAATITAE